MPRTRSLDPARSLRFLLAGSLALAAATLVGTSAVHAQDADDPVESPTAVEEPTTGEPGDEPMAAVGIDGTWTIDTELGSFEEFNNSWVGFRVAEVLNPGGNVDAVGRTPSVSGELTVAGTAIESASIEVDLTGIVSDRPRRDGAIQRALDTTDFPAATFELNEPVDLGAVPADNEPFEVSLPGTITIHGVPQDVSLDLQGARVGDVVLVVGRLPVDFTSFGVTMPTAPIVVSVEDSGDLEWNLWFRHGGAEAPADAEVPEAAEAPEASAVPEG